MNKKMKIVIYGAGAIGTSVAAWVAKKYENIYLLARGEGAKIIKEKGIITQDMNESEKRENIKIKVIGHINEARDADVLALAVKNYDLEATAKDIRAAIGDKPIIIGLQNGVANQTILPNYFSKIIYGVIGYNAWIEKAGVVRYREKGPLILGALENELEDEMKSVADIFNLGLETILTDRFQDAVHSKLIINLTGALTTLLGNKFQEIPEQALVQKLFMNLLLEGVMVVKMAGYKEYKIDGMPSWNKIRRTAKLPQFMTRRKFKDHMQKMGMSSMTQDIIQRGKHDSELESINGYFMELAEQYGFRVPYNRTIYELCQAEFAEPEFAPMDAVEVWDKVKAKLKR